MKKAKAIIAAGVLLVLPGTSRAAGMVFLEPAVGIGKTEVDIAAGSSSTGGYYGSTQEGTDVTEGFCLGIKGGFNFGKKFFFGADYHTGGPYKFGKQLNQAEWTHRMLGAGLGLDYTVIRFWGGYYPSDQFEDTKNNISYNGSAWKVGFGLAVVKNIRANLELIFHRIGKREMYGYTEDYDDFKVLTTNVTVSIPINL